ncbi:hypothetical protein GCM10022223_14980 [Kineosporia mesophila]|uniref:Ketoreductase domain-containing protein n=1 Tax=Kineosporia mesophila TaxID=566012 RepID=A0ABP6Z713_9ACTN|nr:SDR family oxidoreductase [Kineosporia mesophila]MCD5352974.1 SDR family oxidoreductase [Kineosporia mesophila]
MSSTIVLTGGTGYLGSRLAERLLEITDHRLVLLARDPQRARQFIDAWGADGQKRVDVVPTDLRDGTIEGVARDSVTHVVHSAALIFFNVEKLDAQAVNVDGTRAVTEFARRCPNLQRYLAFSSLYSAGTRTGRILEQPHPPESAFANHYEWSKARSEQEVLDGASGLPLTIVRPGTVIADGPDGRVTQYNAFHNTLKLFFYGLLSLMPGDAATPMYLTTADFTATAAAHLLLSPRGEGIYHLGPDPDETQTLGELIDQAFDVFESDPAFRRRRLLRPEFCDVETFRHLVDASRSLGTSPMSQALQSVAPFAEQMFKRKHFDTTRLHAAWPEHPGTDSPSLTHAVIDRLVASRWGRNQEGTSWT